MIKLITKNVLAFAIISLCSDIISAETAFNQGKVETFMATFTHARETQRGRLPLKVSEAREFTVKVNVNNSMVDYYKIIGSVNEYPGSTFFFEGAGNKIEGKIILYNTKEAFDFYTNNLGEVLVKKIDINKVVCVDYDAYTVDAPVKQEAPKNTVMSVPQPQDMESLPGAAGCVYIDFDGEYVSGSTWNGGTPIDAQPAGFTDAQMRNAWMACAEDFKPFQINVTTNRAVYDSYPNTRKNMHIITVTNWRGSGGVAYVNSWSDTKAEPSWGFNLTDKSCYMTISHEVGHTLGLSHDGTSAAGYYAGHASWGPIMGAPFSKAIVHWSIGEYADANMKEDDYAIITKSANGTPYRVDDHANTGTASATLLVADATGKLDAAKNNGIIETRADKDVFKFTAAAGPASFTFTGGPRYPDLDMQVRLLNSSGTEVLKVDPAGLNAILSTTISTAGTYYLEIDGVGFGDPLNTGYSDYGSRGYFIVTGKYTPSVATIIEEVAANPQILVYPNPGTGLFTLKLDRPSEDIQIEVFNTMGQKIVSKDRSHLSADNSSTIDLTYLPQGIYRLRVVMEGGSLSSYLIKQ